MFVLQRRHSRPVQLLHPIVARLKRPNNLHNRQVPCDTLFFRLNRAHQQSRRIRSNVTAAFRLLRHDVLDLIEDPGKRRVLDHVQPLLESAVLQIPFWRPVRWEHQPQPSAQQLFRQLARVTRPQRHDHLDVANVPSLFEHHHGHNGRVRVIRPVDRVDLVPDLLPFLFVRPNLFRTWISFTLPANSASAVSGSTNVSNRAATSLASFALLQTMNRIAFRAIPRSSRARCCLFHSSQCRPG